MEEIQDILLDTQEHQLVFLEKVSEILKKYITSFNHRDKSVIKLCSQEELQNKFSEAEVHLSITSTQAPHQLKKMLRACELVLEYSTRTSHPLFMSQLYSQVDVIGLVGDWIATVLNTNVHTYEAAPVFTVIELEVIKKMTSLVGFPTEDSEGIFCPGGSISNLYGLHLARFAKFPKVKKQGNTGLPNKLIAFTSKQSHYSISKCMSLLGLGTDQLIEVETDQLGQIKIDRLEEEIIRSLEQGFIPFFMNGTAGTTVTGAFDDFEKMAQIAKKYDIWFHIDACWGGALLFSPELTSEYMRGASLCDSLSFNPHKLFGLPLQCSLFLSRHRGLLSRCNSSKADYLFHHDKLFAEMDLGDQTFMCGRKADAFKFWLSIKGHGDLWFQEKVERMAMLAKHLVQLITTFPEGAFALVSSSAVTVCFWYIPPPLRPFKGVLELSEHLQHLLHITTSRIRSQLQKNGSALIAYQPIGGQSNCFRLVFNHSDLTCEDLYRLLHLIQRCGDDFSYGS
eukprot:TRINITY_DN7834_c0_g1_i1.p1 TRINITY_DN7834_c0_g1~~TRINITY_DN7834_c0_g1_i1.p1  ORF type:complete len:509 (+),score=57.84 TRINITY_DN7834_c0_g1_i1:86-1612(+)